MKQKLKTDMFSAMRNKETYRKEALSLTFSTIVSKEKELKRLLTDAEILAIIRKMIANYKISYDNFAIRKDEQQMVEYANKQFHLQAYLPTALSEEEIRAAALEIIAEKELALSIRSMGAIMAELKGKADGKTISKIVKKILTEVVE